MNNISNFKVETDENSKLYLSLAGNGLFFPSYPVVYYKRINTAEFLRSVPVSAEKNNGVSYKFDDFILDMTLEKLCDDTYTISGKIKNISNECLEIARVNWIETELKNRPEFHSITLMHDNSGTVKPDDEYVSTIKFLEEDTWGQWGVNWHRYKDPIHMQNNFPRSVDVAAVSYDENTQLTFGFIGPGTAFGEISYGTCRENPLLLCAVLLDGIYIDPNEERILETLMIFCGKEKDGLDRWAQLCSKDMHIKKPEYAPVGYCSWYQFYDRINYSQYKEVIDSFADWPETKGKKIIQLDDGFQNYPGDWRPNERFIDSFDNISKEIEKTNGVSGLWIAPTTIFKEHPFVKDRPELMQRLENGDPAVTFSNWGWCRDIYNADSKFWGKNCYLEIDNPECQKFIAAIIKSAVNKGYKYLKLDFTYAVSTARVPYDRKKTSFETLKGLYRLFREAAGDDIYICACIGENGRYALPYVNSCRVGADIGSNFKQIKLNLPDFLLRIFTNGKWWSCDPDVFFMRDENTQLNLEESWLLTGTIAVLGCIFLTSDSANQWSEEAKRRVKLFWNSDGVKIPQTVEILKSTSELPDAILSVYNDNTVKLAVYNFDDDNKDVIVDLSKTEYKFADKNLVSLEGDISAEIKDNKIYVNTMFAHSIRLFDLKK